MKRNNIFMWAYISFIIISALLRIFLEFSLWNPIVLAITVSSVFFALEDLFASLYHTSKDFLDIFDSFTPEVRKKYDKEKRFLEKIGKTIMSYEDMIQDIELKNIYKSLSCNFHETDDLICSLEKYNEEKRNKLNTYEKAANIWAYFGFLCLFCTLIIATLSTVPEIAQEIFTVVAFAFILIAQQLKYIPFIPESIEGQAVLGNFNRILKYKGADDVSMVLQRGMPLYEMERQETVGENPDGNMVIRGECVSACAYLKEQGIQVDLVYIDPPFASGADYAKKVYIRRNPKVAEAIAQAERELDIDELKAFEEKMYGDVWDKEKYLNWMYENLMAIKSVMSETGSFYVHLDYHIGHYVKILMDEIFGEDHFKNEIIWYYETYQGTVKNYFPRKHDTLFLYTKSDEYVFNLQYSISGGNPVRQHEAGGDQAAAQAGGLHAQPPV